MEVQKFQYGNDFIVKLIASVLVDTKFLLKCLDLEIWKYIQSQPHQWLMKQIVDYYVLYKGIISLDSLKLKLDNVKQIVLKQSISNVYVSLLQTLDELQPQQRAFIQDTAINFCRRQELKFALVQSVQLWESNGQYQQIYDIINKTRYKGRQTNLGVEYVDSFFDRHTMKTEKTIQSPWPIINTAIKGGFKQSKLYLILAPSGVGKSWMLCNIAAEAMKNHKNVVYYALQMTQFEIGQRIDSKVLGKPIEFIRHPKNIEHMNQLIQPYRSYLRIVEMLPNKTRVLDLENHYNQLKLYQNFQADIIIIDYGDILKKQGNINNMYTAYGDVFTALKTMAKQYKVPVVSATQGSRTSMNSQIILGDQVSHSIGKIQIADFVLSFSRTHSDRMSNTARFTVVKNRGGQDGMVYNGYVDLEIGSIEIYDTYTKKSVEARQKMDNNDALMKQKIKQRLQLLNKNKQENTV